MVKNTGMSDIVEKEKIGVLIEYSKEGFRKGLDELILMKKQWKKMGEKMKKIYANEYSWKEMEKRLIELYNNII